MKRAWIAAVALVAIGLAEPVRAGSYSQLIVFGDSLSDTGNAYLATGGPDPSNPMFGPGTQFETPPYHQGRFSNGPVWVEHLGDALGLSTSPYLAGGSNYAFGGAETGDGLSRLYGTPNINGMVDQFVATAPALSGDELIVLWGGGNNVLADLLLNPPGTPPDLTKPLTDTVTAIAALAAKGGKEFLVPNLPNMGALPLFAGYSDDDRAGLDLLTQGFNGALEAQLSGLEANLGITIHRLDTYGLFADMRANPSAYGLTNVSDPALNRSDMSVNPDAGSFLFWDEVHPTGHVHEFLGNAALRAVPEPSTIGLCLVGLTAAGLWSWRRKS